MTTRSRGPMAGFGWLKRGITMTFRHPKTVLGGSGFLLLACLLPTLCVLPFELGGLQGGVQSATFGWLTAGSALVGLLLVPLYGGFMQVIDATERGLPVRARDIFAPYRQGDALRLIGYGLAMLVVYAALFGSVIVATGGGIARWYMQVISAQLAHQPPPTALPDSFGIVFALLMVCGLFVMGVYSISLGQVALRRRSVFGAIGDGIVGALKNLLPLLVFAIGSALLWIVAVVCIVLVVGLLALLGKLVGTWLVFVIIVPFYLAFLLATFAVMFAVMYSLWRDVCEGDAATPAPVAQSIAA